jgi:hypothetical protein
MLEGVVYTSVFVSDQDRALDFYTRGVHKCDPRCKSCAVDLEPRRPASDPRHQDKPSPPAAASNRPAGGIRLAVSVVLATKHDVPRQEFTC